MIRIALLALCGLTLSCSGFNKPLSKSVIAEQYNSQFLYWCTQEGVWDVFIELPEQCESDVSRGEWDHYPITITAEDALTTETLEAIEAFNAQVGFELFAYRHTLLDPDVVIIDDGPRPFLYAVAKQLTVEGRHYGAVLTYNDLGAADRSDVIMHELGHIVGLRHDRYNPKSVMFHTDGLLVQALERQDIAALRALYLR